MFFETQLTVQLFLFNSWYMQIFMVFTISLNWKGVMTTIDQLAIASAEYCNFIAWTLVNMHNDYNMAKKLTGKL